MKMKLGVGVHSWNSQPVEAPKQESHYHTFKSGGQAELSSLSLS